MPFVHTEKKPVKDTCLLVIEYRRQLRHLSGTHKSMIENRFEQLGIKQYELTDCGIRYEFQATLEQAEKMFEMTNERWTAFQVRYSDGQKHHFKVLIEKEHLLHFDDVDTIMDILAEGAICDPFEGFWYIIARYDSWDTACARALDAESSVYCGTAQIEETLAWPRED